ncbi:MAG TPA: 4Fe-4S dicluster domain-containing protein [Bacteroidales bacterium]|nr:4Fe-4S dicluster domain-containing protein [Bacteroidales bacterium]HPS49226.1 4Fe-4S dicluster domain-containing protein [Bacteroidales bacterium]
MKEQSKNKSTRREFLKQGLVAGAGIAAGTGLISSLLDARTSESVEKVKVMTTDGQIREVDIAQLKLPRVSREESHYGIPGRKFVMVIDLAKCKNARKCVEACQKGHHLPKGQEFMKIYLLQDSDKTSPYWFPKPCFHCDNPLCVSVCPVGATYKRSDGIVLVDNERCIGCKFCMTGCPYSSRVFAWKHYPEFDEDKEPYSPEAGSPGKEGTVSKCDFCPDLIRVGKVPYCVSACPMGVIYFGDIDEDTVTNGTDTFQFSQLIKDRAGYRYLENLGTRPCVYYLPPVDRQYDVSLGFGDLNEEIKNRYNETPYVKKHKP